MIQLVLASQGLISYSPQYSYHSSYFLSSLVPLGTSHPFNTLKFVLEFELLLMLLMLLILLILLE